jgi:membrane protein
MSSTKPNLRSLLLRKIRWARAYLDRTIWDPGNKDTPSWECYLRSTLRMIAISIKGMKEHGLFSRSAGLSYGVMMALGPMIAIAAWISTAFVQADAEVQIKRILMFVSPSLQELLNVEGPNGANSEMGSALDNLITQIVQGADALVDQINTDGSKAFGAMGSIVLIWLVIQLMTSIETTFNRIWGVRKGRSWGQRIITYWSFISLGTVLGLGSTALFSASNLAAVFEWVPFGQTLTPVFVAFSPLLSFLMLVILLCLFYMFFPNTKVQFRPALAGATFAAIFLLANNYLSILYIHRVVSLQSLYGSLGIIPVLMIGLYFFWILILMGGQMTYSVQNVQFLTNQYAWRNLSNQAREILTLAVMLKISRRYLDCAKPPTSDEISANLQAPTNTVNESLTDLEDLGWVFPVNLHNEDGNESLGYQPAVPLEKLTLGELQEKLACVGNQTPISSHLTDDVVVAQYIESKSSFRSQPFLLRSLREILDDEQP